MNNVPPVVSTLDCLRRGFLTMPLASEFLSNAIFECVRRCSCSINDDVSPSSIVPDSLVIGTNCQYRHLSFFPVRCRRDFILWVAVKWWRIVGGQSSGTEVCATEAKQSSDDNQYPLCSSSGKLSLCIERMVAR